MKNIEFMKIKAEVILNEDKEFVCMEIADIEKRELPLTIFEGNFPVRFKSGKVNQTQSAISNRFTKNIEKIFADNFRADCYCSDCGENHAKLVVEITHENED